MQSTQPSFVTVSTVEQHLTRIYRKLDVKNRDKLPTELLAFLEQDPNVAGALN
ncbi:putative regulatory protein [Streptomyces albus]|uniref:Putative regulatory protein n=1 Tax=Streptomyces albus (strain ATCC 21838 / DSM 41398 / FERM P-419 / JCM 4703 / NBRC 107858) TaxID=1081613 RepID=A0A0B5EY17_STRA4|nr:putative regulatory protein [Streptomyces albus]